jgi:hypothetical protein
MWENQQPKDGAPTKTWDDPTVLWDDPNYDWNGRALEFWTNVTPT